ncbi:histidine phosphatase family protein [uncultured Propionibacterium sp.]|uniref:histidine phosphatase family protein n=1 Tax=uncultured Propionibacterium sp. TaxID=218066 RepID=UPI00292F8917|nr:histidine phosphatase family protein [uncultured Propionibacterium sp.]
MTETKGPIEIYLVRHGETWFNKLDRVQGWCGTPLTPKGFAVAEAIGRAFASAGIDFRAAYCGDMLRHHETMATLLRAMGSSLEPISRFGLREMSFGAWEGMPNNLMWEAAYRVLGVSSTQEALGKGFTLIDIFDVFSRTNPDTDYPSDNVRQAADRALSTLDEIADDEAGPGAAPRILVVSSGVTIACILHRLGAELRTPVHNGGVSRLLRDDDRAWTVLGHDDVSWAERGGWQG